MNAFHYCGMTLSVKSYAPTSLSLRRVKLRNSASVSAGNSVTEMALGWISLNFERVSVCVSV